MQSLYPTFTNPFPQINNSEQAPFDPSRPRAELPFHLLTDFQRLAHPALDYTKQPSSGHPSSYRYDRSSFDSAASASSAGPLYDPAYGAPHSAAYTPHAPPIQHIDTAASPPGNHSETGDRPNRFTSQSPASSPVAARPDPPARLNMNFNPSSSAPSAQDHFPHTQRQHPSLHSPSDRFPPLSNILSSASNRYPRIDRFAFPPASERRMSEPVPLMTASGHFPQSYAHPPSYSLHRPSSSGGSFSDLYSGPEWVPKKELDERGSLEKGMDGPGGMPSFNAFDEAYSPIHSTFSGASSNSSVGPGLHSPNDPRSAVSSGAGGGGYALYDKADEDPSSRPSTSGSPSYSYASESYPGMVDQTNKTYSFVSLPGNTVRKRPRRRYDEIERLYSCNHPGCTKAYGTLNHLNAHVNMQKHGAKRHPNEFKELRKQWRKVKKEQEHERDGRGPGTAQRRRRATEPNLFTPSGPSVDDSFPGDTYHDPHQPHLQQTLGNIDLSYPPGGGGSGGSFPESTTHLGQIGYGHHHYANPPAYHNLSQRRVQTSPTPVARSMSLGMSAYHQAHSQAMLEAQRHPPSPPPINRLPPDSTLLTPLHPAPATFHPSLPLPRIHGSTPPLTPQHPQGSGRPSAYDTYASR